MKKLLSIYLSFFLIASPVMAQEAAMKSIMQGEAAPFDGTLLNQAAVAEMLIKLNKTEEFCKLKLKEEREIQKTNCNLAVDNKSTCRSKGLRRGLSQLNGGLSVVLF